MVHYEGIFFEEENAKLISALDKENLPVINDELHCTFKVKPTEEELFDTIVGKEVEIELVGYGNNGENSGFEIRFPVKYAHYYINYDEERPNKLKVPHITASIVKGAKAYKTKDLDFQPLEKPIKVTGKFGYWIKEDDGTEHLSYLPYIKNKQEK